MDIVCELTGIHSIINVSSIPKIIFAGGALICEIYILQQTSYIFSTKSFSALPLTYILSADLAILP